MAKSVAPFHDLDDATFDQESGIETVNPSTTIGNAAFCHFATLSVQQVRDGFQGRGLPRPIGAEERHNPAFRNFERYTLEYQDDVVIDHFDIIDP
jgi:hypothetical protein